MWEYLLHLAKQVLAVRASERMWIDSVPALVTSGIHPGPAG
jgi:hypothetical protein